MPEFVDKKITSTTEFLQNIRFMLDNTFNFENIAIKERYLNGEIPFMEESSKNLIYNRNIIQEKYLDRVMNRRRKTVISEEKRQEYDLNPYMAADELLGTPDYWWLLLMVNKKMNVHEFTKLGTSIYTPDMVDLKDCLLKEFNKNKDIGEII
ncbi:MAG: hypothetical protein ACRC5M_04855 [Anaeroplasmataceae bacterium]